MQTDNSPSAGSASGNGGGAGAAGRPAADDRWDEAAVEAAVIERCSGLVPLAGRLIRAFVQQTGEDIASIEAAVAAGDPVAMGRAAHRLKGAAASLGLEACRAAATELLTLGHAGRTEGTEAFLAILHGQADRLARMRIALETPQG